MKDQESRITNTATLSVFSIIIASIAMCLFAFAKPIEYNPMITWYNASGMVPKPGKIWLATVPITTANAQVVDISSAGFTAIESINVAGANNSASITAQPNCIVKTNTLTSVTFNTTVSNSAVLAILQGLVFPASTTGMTASIIVIGR